MKKILINGIIAGTILLMINILALFFTISLFPSLAEEYFNPAFDMQGDKSILYFMHPYIVSFALAWFWKRFKTLFQGPYWLRGLEVGLAYGAIAVFPSMWITFSAFSVSLTLVLSWFGYGLIQGIVVGIIYAKLSP